MSPVYLKSPRVSFFSSKHGDWFFDKSKPCSIWREWINKAARRFWWHNSWRVRCSRGLWYRLWIFSFHFLLYLLDIIRKINDPEHPLTLEQLNVVKSDLIQIKDDVVHVNFTPTIPHCKFHPWTSPPYSLITGSMATLIGLCLRVKLIRSLPDRFKVDISITPGTHSSEAAGTTKPSSLLSDLYGSK